MRGEWVATDGTDYGPAIRRWELATGRPAPCPTEPGDRTNRRLSPVFTEWMTGMPVGWVTDVPGMPRKDQLKALGNIVVPQQGAEAFRFLIERATAAPMPTEVPIPAAALTAVPLFPEVPVSPTTTVPLGAPKAWHRVVIKRAQGRCECAGHCGIAHKQSGDRCPRLHGGRHKKHDVVLILAPKKQGLSLHVAAGLPDAELMAWCAECLAKAEKLAAPPA